MDTNRQLTTFWQFNMRADLTPERHAEVLSIARDLYQKRFHIPAPAPATRRHGAVLILAFPLPENDPPHQMTLEEQ
jgi:hypothetical protein